MSSETQARVPAGVHTGGQFAAEHRGEPDVTLAPPVPYDIADALAQHGVPVGLLHGVDSKAREILLDQIENRGLDRQAARDLVTDYQAWWTASDTGRLYLGRAFRLEGQSRAQLREALEVRNRLTIADGVERIEEAERDVMGSWQRWMLARDDLRVVSGETPRDIDAIARATDPAYRGQLMPYPPVSGSGGLFPLTSQMVLELDAAEAAKG